MIIHRQDVNYAAGIYLQSNIEAISQCLKKRRGITSH
jgi:hypothetical protein